MEVYSDIIIEITKSFIYQIVDFLKDSAQKEKIRIALSDNFKTIENEPFFNQVSILIESGDLSRQLIEYVECTQFDKISKEERAQQIVDACNCNAKEKIAIKDFVLKIIWTLSNIIDQPQSADAKALARGQQKLNSSLKQHGKSLRIIEDRVDTIAKSITSDSKPEVKYDCFHQTEEIVTADCITSIQELGVNRENATSFVEKDIENKKYGYIYKNQQQNVRMLIDEFGAGKTHACQVIFISLQRDYKSGISKVIPILFKAQECPELEKFIVDHCNSNSNYYIIIDGLDEIGSRAANGLLHDCIVLSNINNNCRFLLASRPMLILNNQPDGDKISVKRLSNNEIELIFQTITDEDTHITRMPSSDPIFLILSIPMFCIFAANSYKDDPYNWEKDKISLINNYLLRNGVDDDTANENYLIYLAKEAVEYNYGEIPITSIDGVSIPEGIIASGLIARSADSVRFNLPIIAQYYAAKAINKDPSLIDSVLARNPIAMEWFYPISFYFDMISFSSSKEQFTKIIEKSPYLAAKIITEGITTGNSFVLPSTDTCGQNITDTMDIWVRNLGRFARAIAPVDETGQLCTLDINTTERRISLCWTKKHYTERYRIRSWRQMVTELSIAKEFAPKESRLWPWCINFDYLKENVNNYIIERRFISECPSLREEYLWKIALILAPKNNFFASEITISTILTLSESLQKDTPVIISSRGKTYRFEKGFFRTFYLELVNIQAEGINVIVNPHPSADVLEPKDTYHWSFYSKEQLKKRINSVFQTAFQAFFEITKSWDCSITQELPFNVLAPIRMIIKYHIDETNGILYNMIFYPLPLGKAKSELVLIDVDEKEIKEVNLVSLNEEKHYIAINRSPQFENAIYWTSSGVLQSDIFGDTPSAWIVGEWLKSNLQSINWL